ncbi:MAG: hypothetical protein M3441_20100 [Chloroflexota bacterium]|nr:hypothetical protein [Chloroflexota bacterium]
MAPIRKATVEHSEATASPQPLQPNLADTSEQLAVVGTTTEGNTDPGKRSPSPLKQRGMKKYQIVVPESLFEEIEKIAASRQTTVIDIIRRFLKLGLLTTKIENTPNAGLFIREGDSEREIILL